MKIILQKFIAESGYCSRRQAEKLIRAQKVVVNGELAELGKKVGEKDEVKVNGQAIKPLENKNYIKLNKPFGYVCTNKKFKGEKNVFDLIGLKKRLFVVGRLDKNSRGLLILTNDGDWAQMVAHPKFKHEKEYEVKIAGKNLGAENSAIINKFMEGVNIGAGSEIVRAKSVKYLGNNKFKVILAQGKKRQLRRMFKKIGYEVEDLKRLRIAWIKLGKLKTGAWQYFSPKFKK